ncbi:m7GpppX diphosphatase [Nematocida sp. AWRm80]|nr:m7GpppX diphosphatase [Nematocida sp. AWRm80]
MSKLAKFIPVKILSSKIEIISKIYLGKINNEDAVLIINKTDIPESIPTAITDSIIHENDVYTNGTIESKELMKYTIIHPASSATILKYTQFSHVMVLETYEMYKSITLPLALKKGPSSKWIDNIITEIEGQKAPYTTTMNEIVLYNDNDFFILPDLKWDRANLSSLYLLLIFKDPAIYSLRELTAEHLPILNRIKEVVKVLLKETYNLDISSVCLYFHYYPTFFRAHIHISSLCTSWMGTKIGSSILLNDVIDNITMNSNYYQRKSLEIVISQGSYLYQGYLKGKDSLV